ncbi:MAG: 2'-5' RNA ligase family protein [Arachnia sp.]
MPAQPDLAGQQPDWPGHAVVQIGVPELEPWSVDRARHYDPGFVSRDPGFRHAHITILAPLTSWDAPALAQLAARTPAFGFRLAEVGVFGNGIIHLRPEPEAAFGVLSAAALDAHPGVVPNGGPDPRPHLTLDALGPGVSLASTRAAVRRFVPAECVADALELVWYESGNCHLIQRWPLSGAP